MDEMGPKGKIPEDTRLEALLAHRRAVESAPEPAKNQSLVKALLPLMLAQGADLASTEVMLHRGGKETNPLPGMQTTAGRVGWNALEAALLTLLAKKGLPIFRDKLAPAAHSTLAGQNMVINRGALPDDRIGVFIRRRP